MGEKGDDTMSEHKCKCGAEYYVFVEHEELSCYLCEECFDRIFGVKNEVETINDG